jgi:hypothetical protein
MRESSSTLAGSTNSDLGDLQVDLIDGALSAVLFDESVPFGEEGVDGRIRSCDRVTLGERQIRGNDFVADAQRPLLAVGGAIDPDVGTGGRPGHHDIVHGFDRLPVDRGRHRFVDLGRVGELCSLAGVAGQVGRCARPVAEHRGATRIGQVQRRGGGGRARGREDEETGEEADHDRHGNGPGAEPPERLERSDRGRLGERGAHDVAHPDAAGAAWRRSGRGCTWFTSSRSGLPCVTLSIR